MIKIIQNPNFSQWFNILLDGKLIDNAKSRAQALRIAKQLQAETREPIKTGARIISSIEKV
ncbi:MAG: hypothetical protein EBY39_13415 [Flavobacteriia bacterium]|jgi:hypothetical protein|nr:hypothetical protein [Flavobacteriia bacterium]